MIRQYQDIYHCRLIVFIDEIFPDNIVLLEDLVYDADPEQDLHVLLDSPGGDGETALRIISSLQARCRELTVVIPDQAKSAATLLALGADHLLMGPTSDLGPVDPQFRISRPGGGYDLIAAKDMVDAVERAEQAVALNPNSFPVHSALLADLKATDVAAARSAIARSSDLVFECLTACSARTPEQAAALADSLQHPLINAPRSHAAVFGPDAAAAAGLPVRKVHPRDSQWELVWRLYTKYRTLPHRYGVYEGLYASQLNPRP